MERRPLGNSSLQVSALCLGTMTWGQQNTEAEAHAQLDYAVDCGINFIDAAELYPVPPRAETSGLTETYLGTWLKNRPDRDKLVIATKIAGPTDGFRVGLTWIREGKTHFNAQHIQQAVDGSLKRLQTDYIDLYQLHWPDRHTNFFGQLGYTHERRAIETELAETLAALQTQVEAGKIRMIGVSNETPWGVMHALKLAEIQGLPRVMSIQNPYSLLNRTAEVGLAEVALREQCGILAYSPLAFGVLSGKYLDDTAGPDARLNAFVGYFDRYSNPQATAATQRYVALAREVGLTPTQLALAFVTSRPFVTSNIIGATRLDQLAENIATAEITLSDDVLAAIEAIHTEIPNPSP